MIILGGFVRGDLITQRGKQLVVVCATASVAAQIVLFSTVPK